MNQKNTLRKPIRLIFFILALLILVFGLLFLYRAITGTTYDLEPDYARGLDITIALAMIAASVLFGLLGRFLKTN